MNPGARAAAVAALVSLSLLAEAASIGTALFGMAPHISGTVRPGEADEVAQDFSEPLKYPLSIKIDPLSDPLELMKIGLWLQQRRPVAQLRESCVGACARAILLSTGPLTIKPGTVIAFGGTTDFSARMKDQVDAGELFIDDEHSRASRERLLQKFSMPIARSLALRVELARQVPLPAETQAFIDAVTGGWRIKNLGFTDELANFRLAAGPHGCLWWVPDAQGLRQLGLDVPGYRPVSAAVAAKLLKVPERVIHVGPVLHPVPEAPLCPTPQDTPGVDFPELP